MRFSTSFIFFSAAAAGAFYTSATPCSAGRGSRDPTSFNSINLERRSSANLSDLHNPIHLTKRVKDGPEAQMPKSEDDAWKILEQYDGNLFALEAFVRKQMREDYKYWKIGPYDTHAEWADDLHKTQAEMAQWKVIKVFDKPLAPPRVTEPPAETYRGLLM
ncbi:hypothetical protein BC835DRAFT_852012 [Cytidiella melzeri]|nr:hypothetical protein BC835DRAFT_852012 [Cytidiella melzeri]